MRFLRSQKKDVTAPLLSFQISAREEGLLLATLRLYPEVETGHHRISKEAQLAATAEQMLLEESMSQLREAHRRKLDELFRAPGRFFKEGPGQRRLVLTGEQLEWLLQVLNDIRVGSWVRLGCPEMEDAARIKPTRANARALEAMNISGQFQAVLLEAVQ
jgi:hypothetical protein